MTVIELGYLIGVAVLTLHCPAPDKRFPWWALEPACLIVTLCWPISLLGIAIVNRSRRGRGS